MITEEKAIEIVKHYLEERKCEYLSIDKVFYEENEYINYGEYESQHKNVFVVSYSREGYQLPTDYFVYVLAETGEVLFTMTPHGYAEDWEED
ncbi:MAG: hypothetical protein V4604_11725 [Bacteroidota bacterium]